MTRAELVGELMDTKRGIAITGTHGKTTTTSMMAYALIEAGMDPTVLVGAPVPGIPGGARLGTGDIMVIEADEAYGSFLTLKPEIAAVTSIDDDHRDYYGTFEGIVRGFAQFLDRVKAGGLMVLCSDDANVVHLSEAIKGNKVLYGIGERADYTATDICFNGFGSRFRAVRRGETLGWVELAVPGRHNICNSLAVIAIADVLGIDILVTARALKRFTGAGRRCQIVGAAAGVTVVDDYAHHPAEIRATLSALRDAHPGRLIAVFQPQRFTRTRFLRNEFARAFGLADVIAVTEVYSEGTGEAPIPGVSGEDLSRAISEYEGRAVAYVPDREAVRDFLRHTVRAGDLVVTMGAGDIYRAAQAFARELADR